MKKRKSYSINRLDLPKDIVDISFILAGFQYDDATGYGITEIEIIGDVLSAVLIKRSFTYVNGFDIIKKEFEKKSISIFSEIRFFIDFEFKMLYTRGVLTNLLQVKSLLRNIFDFEFEISGLEIAPYKIYQALKKSKIKFEIQALTIEKFNYNDGAIGKYFASITDIKIGEELIKLYSDKVFKIVFKLYDYQVFYLNNNTLSIVAEEDEFEEKFQNFKTIIK